MKTRIGIIIRLIELWSLEDLERLQSELECIIDTTEKETCEQCGLRKVNGHVLCICEKTIEEERKHNWAGQPCSKGSDVVCACELPF